VLVSKLIEQWRREYTSAQKKPNFSEEEFLSRLWESAYESATGKAFHFGEYTYFRFKGSDNQLWRWDASRRWTGPVTTNKKGEIFSLGNDDYIRSTIDNILGRIKQDSSHQRVNEDADMAFFSYNRDDVIQIKNQGQGLYRRPQGAQDWELVTGTQYGKFFYYNGVQYVRTNEGKLLRFDHDRTAKEVYAPDSSLLFTFNEQENIFDPWTPISS
jgi:hypothetical protein